MIVDSAPHALNQDYSHPHATRGLLNKYPGIYDVLVSDWKNGNFDNTRRLTVLQNDIHAQALATLQLRYDSVYRSLVLRVSAWNQWKENDIQLNNCIVHPPNGSIHSEIPALKAVHGFQDSLSQRRSYFDGDRNVDLSLAKTRYKHQFDNVFVNTPNLPSPNPREYFSFLVNHTFLKDSVSANQHASNFKAAIFCHLFVHTPFLHINSGPRLNYKQDQSWEFPIFLTLHDDTTVKYTPKSDWSVMDNKTLCPLVISEIVSQKNEEDKQRMLMQAIAAVRIGQHFTDATAQPKKWFFVVAIYLTADLKAQGYILVSEGGSDAKAPQVHTVSKTFNLKDSDAANQIFLEMLNLRDRSKGLSENLGREYEGMLQLLTEDAKGLKSLHSKDRPASRRNNPEDGGQSNNFNSFNNNANTVARNRGLGDGGYGDMYGVFETPELRNELDKLDYEILYSPYFNPNLAVVQPKNDPETKHYVKFIPEYSKGLQIITYLNGLKPPSSYIIRPIGSSTFSGGSLMAMLGAGRWMKNIQDLAIHFPDFVLQLLEGVQFLHENLVAHLYLKPENLLASTTDPSDPKLTIIDFSCAVRVTNQSTMITSVVGTDGYMAPEIGSGPYNPFKADLWSFGMVLKQLCEAAGEFPQRSLILTMAGQLMQRNPNLRPALSEILQWTRDTSNESIGVAGEKNSSDLQKTLLFPTKLEAIHVF